MYLGGDSEIFFRRDFSHQRAVQRGHGGIIDRETKTIIDECYGAPNHITDNLAKLHRVVEVQMDKEKLIRRI
jgi:ATP-dependent Zn protease